jgi:hypothetical protein
MVCSMTTEMGALVAGSSKVGGCPACVLSVVFVWRPPGHLHSDSSISLTCLGICIVLTCVSNQAAWQGTWPPLSLAANQPPAACPVDHIARLQVASHGAAGSSSSGSSGTGSSSGSSRGPGAGVQQQQSQTPSSPQQMAGRRWHRRSRITTGEQTGD